MKTQKKRGPNCTRRVKRHTSELGAGHGVLAEGTRLSQDNMLQSAKQGRTALSVTQPKMDGVRRLPAKQPQQIFFVSRVLVGNSCRRSQLPVRKTKAK